MARRKLSMGGRVLAAGLSVGVAGVLVGSMAAGDHSAGASHPATVPDRSDSATGFDGGSAQPHNPYSNDDSSSRDTGNSSAPSAPQPHTRSGGS
jgi:hypothetical protein